MEVIEYLISASILSGFKIYDEEEYIRIINYEIDNKQIEFIEYQGKPIGFFGWLVKKDENGTNVCVNNFFILGKYKGKFNIVSLRRFFRQKYPDIYLAEWHSQKKNEFRKLVIKRSNNESKFSSNI